jgi:DNA-binding MarR family transcriptional regulator
MAIETGTNRVVAYAIRRAALATKATVEDALRDLNLTMLQYGTLCALRAQDRLSNAELARRHHVTPQTMNPIVVHLEDAGLIERAPLPGHGPILAAQITGAGLAVLDEADRRVEKLNERMVAALSAEECDRLIASLEACVAALEGDGPRLELGGCIA